MYCMLKHLYDASYLSFLCYEMSVVSQSYETDADKEYVILGNSAIVKCDIPSFVADFVSVVSWQETNSQRVYTHSPNFGITTHIR